MSRSLSLTLMASRISPVLYVLSLLSYGGLTDSERLFIFRRARIKFIDRLALPQALPVNLPMEISVAGSVAVSKYSATNVARLLIARCTPSRAAPLAPRPLPQRLALPDCAWQLWIAPNPVLFFVRIKHKRKPVRGADKFLSFY
ncbi:hypothetical protein J6590_012293 [Homalodisca vitripennis]|nr:hypothetical protein J6590_012293 [Homalodisca vitripennis]